ncbi:hypothetical protein ACHAWT_001268 [Skeletonema menzelii]
MTQRRASEARRDRSSLRFLSLIVMISSHLSPSYWSSNAPCIASAFQIQASVSVPQQLSTNHHDVDKIETLVKDKLDRIATSYQTIHGEKLRRTVDVELELCHKIEKCFMGANAIEDESTQNLLLSTKLKEKKCRLEECLAVNDRAVHQLLATNSDGGQSSSSLFHHVDFITSAAAAAGSTSVGEYDDLGQLMGNGGLVEGGESNKETDGYDTALQVIHHTARDWTHGAASCREETIMWIVRAIVQYYTQDRSSNDGPHHPLRVLIPGAGLGRLAYEVSTCRDLIENRVMPRVEANDSSVTMIFAAQSVIKMLQEQQHESRQLQSAIHPFLSDPQVNEIDARKRFEMEVFPDQHAIDSYKYYHDLTGTNPNLSFTIGDFVSTYSQQSKQNQYDVVATSFFIDTATNIYEYIYMMKHMLDTNGIWVNCGPVQWHPCALLRPTVEQLKDMLQVAGFDLISWSIADEAVAYRHPDDVGGAGSEEARYTRSEAYRPLRFVARLLASQDDDGNCNDEDLALKIQYSEFLNEVANGKIEVN